jgi:hypothetical protein
VRTLLRLCSAAVMALPVVAGAATAAPAVPVLSDVLKASGIAVSGAIDASYDYSDVDGGPAFHQFDVSQNSFSLHQINLTVAKQPEKGFGFLVNPVVGDDAGIINGGSTADWDLTQGFIQYACGNGLVYMAGRFVTLAGAEVINPAGNLNASRSLLFFNQPLVHTGVRAAWAFNSALTVTAGIVNTANNGLVSGAVLSKTDNNTSKTAELQFALTPFKPMQIFLTGYSGNEDTPAAGFGAGQLRNDTLDLVVNLTVSDALSFALNGDYFQQELATGGAADARGLAGYANYKIGNFRVAGRAEYIDVDGAVNAAPGRGWIREETLTLGYSPASELEFLAEIRNDQVDTGVFNGALALPLRDAASVVNNDQYTATLKAIYKF